MEYGQTHDFTRTNHSGIFRVCKAATGIWNALENHGKRQRQPVSQCVVAKQLELGKSFNRLVGLF